MSAAAIKNFEATFENALLKLIIVLLPVLQPVKNDESSFPVIHKVDILYNF